MQIISLLHIPKTGGSCLRHSFELIKDKPKKINSNVMLTEYGHDKLFEPSDKKAEKFVFFVRSPIKRFVSAFISRLREGKPLYNIPHTDAEKKTFGKYKCPDQLAINLYDKAGNPNTETINYLGAIKHLKLDFRNYLKSCQHLEKNKNNILFVGRTEQLDHDFAKLCKILNVKNIELTKDPILSHKTPDKYNTLTQLSDKAKYNIIKYYISDYQIIMKLKELKLLESTYLNDEIDLAKKYGLI